MAKLRMNQAISRALADEMRADDTVIVLGEDVGRAGGVFKTSEGLLDEFGPLRVRDTPISEMGFIGAALGAAATGLRPVAEIMFVEFLGVALDQLVTEAAKFNYLSAGEFPVPMVVRASCGAGIGYGCQHSQTLEGWFVNTPGLKVAVASGPKSAYGILRAAIRDDNPVVVLEPRVLYGLREEFDTTEAAVELGRAYFRSRGDDVTLVSLGQGVRIAAAAAESASWSADVIDLSTLVPWDVATVMESVQHTGRLVLVEENCRSGGWGADIAAEIGERAFGQLRAPICRITAPDVPVPAGRDLEKWFVPTPEYVAAQVSELIATDRVPASWWEVPA